MSIFMNFTAISWREHAMFSCDDDDVLEQHAEFDLYSSSSLSQQFTSRHVG
jgi:hypothetical protein